MSTNEQWDIVSGVGVTALAVAMARDTETRRPDRLINDPYAAALIEAAQSPLLDPRRVRSEEETALWSDMSNYIAIRTRFLDTWFEHAYSGGARQGVILASGLDTRAFRMTWPEGFRLFEIDQPKVLEFKDGVFASQGVKAACERRAVAVDLRDDWASALHEAGFDTTLPTAWLAEGLLAYLPAAAEAQLVSTVSKMSAPGSHAAIEHTSVARSALTDSQMAKRSQLWGIDIGSLVNTEERPDAGDQLADYGWTVHRQPVRDLVAHSGRELGTFTEHLSAAEFLTATR